MNESDPYVLQCPTVTEEKYYLVEIGFPPISLMVCFHILAANVDKYLQAH